MKDSQSLTTKGDTCGGSTGDGDAVYEAGKRRNATDEESENGAPVAAPSAVIEIDALEVVHVWYRDIATSNNEVAADVLGVVANEVARLGLTRRLGWTSLGPRKWCIHRGRRGNWQQKPEFSTAR